MKTRTLAELLTPDKRTLAFSPQGLLLAQEMTAEGSAEFLQRLVAFELAMGVPRPVRTLYERALTLFPYGLWAYDLFGVLEEDGYLMLETALQHKFLEYYSCSVPLNNRDGRRHDLKVKEYSDVESAVRRGGSFSSREGWHLAGNPGFDGSLSALLRWARTEGIFYGQRNRVVEDAILNLRNIAAHPNPHLVDPVRAAATLRDIGELINRLWGHSGGRLYPPPIYRQVVAVSLGAEGQPDSWIAAEALTSVTDDFKEGEIRFYLAAQQDWDEIPFALTHFPGLLGKDALSLPVRYLWGPGPWREALLVWETHQTDPEWLSDEVEMLDQHFWVRKTPSGEWQGPCRATCLDSLTDVEKTGIWFEVLADSPADVRENLVRLPGLPPEGEQPIPKLPKLMKAPHITTVRRFESWDELMSSRVTDGDVNA